MMNENRNRRGFARLVGIATPSTDGVRRLTRMEDTELHGGSPRTHQAMHDRAQEILAEIERQGYRLDRLTYDDYLNVSALIARMGGRVAV